MKQFFCMITVAGGLAIMAGNATALTVTQCASIFSDQHCATFDVADANNCTCNACQADYPVRSGSIVRQNVVLNNLCGCTGNGSCGINPDTAYRSGTYTCVNGRADWSTCLPTSGGSGGSSCSGYEKCSSASSGGCRNFSITVDGVLYCNTGESCNTTAPGVATAVMVSQYCSDYMGVGGACASFCAVMGCQPGWTPAPGRRSCVCAQGYYRNSSNDCVQCPDGGTTGGIGASSISACYIPANQSISDSTGTYVYTQNCFYK